MEIRDKINEKMKELIGNKFDLLKSLGVEKITVQKLFNSFYNEEIIEVIGNPTRKTWRYCDSHKDELKSQGIYIIKRKEYGNDEWKMLGIIVPSRVYNELIRTEKYAEIKNIQSVSDSIKSQLRPHQLEVIDYNFTVLKEKKLLVDTSDAGTGKTYTSLALVKQMNLTPIMVIPAVSIAGWIRALKFYGITNFYISTYELFKKGKFTVFKKNRKGRITRENVNIPFISFKDGRYVFNWSGSHCLIYDEAHRLKNMKTQNFAFFEQLIDDPPPYMMFLSATISESPAKAVPVFYAMGMNTDKKGFKKFMETIGCVYKGGEWTFDVKNVRNRTALGEIHKILAGYGKRMKLNSIDGLPPDTIIPELYTIDESVLIDNLYLTLSKMKKLQKENNVDEMKKIIGGLKHTRLSFSSIASIKQKIEELQSKLMDAEMENYYLAVRTRLLQIIELNKISLLIDLVSNALEDGYSVAVFLNYTDSIVILAEELKTKNIFTGKNKELGYLDRELCRLAFQDGKESLIIGTFSAMRESVDLHDTIGEHPRMVFMPFSDSAQSFVQALGRVHRTGKITPSIQYIICIEGTIEEQVKQNLEMKLFNLSLINDGDLDPLGVYTQIYGKEESNLLNENNDNINKVIQNV